MARTQAFRLREGKKSAWAKEPSNRRLTNSVPELNPPEASFLRVGYGTTAMASTSTFIGWIGQPYDLHECARRRVAAEAFHAEVHLSGVRNSSIDAT
jgi:hypothetical protein